MKNAKLTALSIERFKSFKQATRIELAPLTIVLGRNNSGKSSIIQSLLLLKQTLNDPRSDVMLGLDGSLVEAFNLRELTFGWPAASSRVEGPTITLEWECEVNINYTMIDIGSPDIENLAKHSGLSLLWLKKANSRQIFKTSITLRTAEILNDTLISKIEVKALNKDIGGAASITINVDNIPTCRWGRNYADKIQIELDHFIPYLRINRSQVGPRDRQRAWHNAYLILFAQPLEALKKLLSELHYLGSSRQPPSSLFKPATSTPGEIGVNGELAAQLLHRRQHDTVHYLPPLQIKAGFVTPRKKVRERSLVEAINRVMKALSITTPLKVKEIEQVGFQLMFGDASLVHVGRGLNSLLPLVELGLFADPLRFTGDYGDMDLSAYREKCTSYSHIALEEPEAHLHPKVASRLAHWMVSLALANRRLIVETHSDHMVRRLRGLAARAGRGSDLEQWLLQNVVVLSVEQSEDGSSTVTTSRLTAEGGVEEQWPADFMDEATDEESAIYYAKLDKSEQTESVHQSRSMFDVIEGDEPELDEAP